MRGQTIETGGNFSKRKMGGAAARANMTISTCAMCRVLEYEPGDLTVSVEAGMRFGDLRRMLAEHRQMIPLDPPFAEEATVGGVIATNGSGPRRRLYGTARDLVIGMKFATLEGKVVETGGMVVKNVAGLDMGKLMIGSFGTLAAMASINLKVIPMPPYERSFRFECASLEEAMGKRDGLLKSPLDPAAMDLMNPAAAAAMGIKPAAWILAVRAGGNTAAMARYERDLSAMGAQAVEEASGFWRRIEEFTAAYLAEQANGAVVRVSCTLKELAAVMRAMPGPGMARAGNGVAYAYFASADEAGKFAAETAREHCETAIEFAAEEGKEQMVLWPAPGQDIEIMRRIKGMFDPQGLLNRGRLYNRI